MILKVIDSINERLIEKVDSLKLINKMPITALFAFQSNIGYTVYFTKTCTYVQIDNLGIYKAI